MSIEIYALVLLCIYSEKLNSTELNQSFLWPQKKKKKRIKVFYVFVLTKEALNWEQVKGCAIPNMTSCSDLTYTWV